MVSIQVTGEAGGIRCLGAGVVHMLHELSRSVYNVL